MPGKLTDLVILSDNIFALKPEAMHNVKVKKPLAISHQALVRGSFLVSLQAEAPARRNRAYSAQARVLENVVRVKTLNTPSDASSSNFMPES
jgi:hypothetical protein